MKKIYLGADHAGFKLKEGIKKYLLKLEYKVFDEGALNFDKTDDYPDFAKKVSKKVAKTKEQGILICGSSQGVCIAANKFKGIRAVSVLDIKDAKLTREHNDANVLCLSGRKLSLEKAIKIVIIWLKTEFGKEIRHTRRLKKIAKLEK